MRRAPVRKGRAINSRLRLRSPDRARRTDNPGKTTAATLEPTSRSAQAGGRSFRSGQAAPEPDPLDNIPPFDLPGDVPRSSSTPPVPPAAEPAAEAAKTPAAKPDVKSDTPAPPANEVDLTSITLPVPVPAPSASVGPGLARFVAVDVKLAGGSLPSTASLDWLVEKGYRTLLDLRESKEVSSEFIAEVTRKGLRYVALPIGQGSIDRDHVARFQFEVAAAEARPLYFFDSDGTRGALWYIRRIATDRVDRQIARREAEELGLFDKGYWSAVTSYVATMGPERTTSNSTTKSAAHRRLLVRQPVPPRVRSPRWRRSPRCHHGRAADGLLTEAAPWLVPMVGQNSGQSAGTGASTDTGSWRVGCVNMICRA